MSNSTVSKLDDLIGLSTAKNVVRRLSQSESGIHAILLYGPKGSGKTELANLIAQMWLCSSPTTEGADGICRPCMSYQRGNSPDLLVVEPQGLSNIITNKAITNSKPGVGEPLVPLLSFFRTPPLLSRHKVTVIRDAHRMNSSSSNALLKTLEEPFPHAKLLLTTDSIGNILPTILSRCVAVACEGPSDAELKAMFPDATVDEIRFAEGAPGRLRSIVERRELYEKLLRFAKRLSKRGPAEALIASEEFQVIMDGFQTATGAGVRAANAEALDALAIYFARDPFCPASWPQQIIESHRRIVGNGGAGLVLDALFTAMLCGNRKK